MGKNDWLKDFFDSGFYEAYWGWQMNSETDKSLAEDTLHLLNAKDGHILDWCGGWGRVSIYYARKGFKISILDFNSEYLNRASHRFQEEGLEVNTILADCRETPTDIQADYATCLFNSVGFLNDAEQSYAFAGLYKSMKSKGRVIVDAMNLFFLAPYINQPYENKNDAGWVFRQNNYFDFMTNTMYSLFEIVNEQRQVLESKPFYQRLYTPRDLMNIMEKAGFKVTEVYGGFKGEKVNFDSPKIVIIGQKAGF